MELATHDDPPAARRYAADALAALPEGWQAATTADDLDDLLIRARAELGAEVEWLAEISAAWDLGRPMRPEWP